jgi:hypothetical protein
MKHVDATAPASTAADVPASTAATDVPASTADEIIIPHNLDLDTYAFKVYQILKDINHPLHTKIITYIDKQLSNIDTNNYEQLYQYVFLYFLLYKNIIINYDNPKKNIKKIIQTTIKEYLKKVTDTVDSELEQIIPILVEKYYPLFQNFEADNLRPNELLLPLQDIYLLAKLFDKSSSKKIIIYCGEGHLEHFHYFISSFFEAPIYDPIYINKCSKLNKIVTQCISIPLLNNNTLAFPLKDFEQIPKLGIHIAKSAIYNELTTDPYSASRKIPEVYDLKKPINISCSKFENIFTS